MSQPRIIVNGVLLKIFDGTKKYLYHFLQEFNIK